MTPDRLTRIRGAFIAALGRAGRAPDGAVTVTRFERWVWPLSGFAYSAAVTFGGDTGQFGLAPRVRKIRPRHGKTNAKWKTTGRYRLFVIDQYNRRIGYDERVDGSFPYDEAANDLLEMMFYAHIDQVQQAARQVKLLARRMSIRDFTFECDRNQVVVEESDANAQSLQPSVRVTFRELSIPQARALIAFEKKLHKTRRARNPKVPSMWDRLQQDEPCR